MRKFSHADPIKLGLVLSLLVVSPWLDVLAQAPSSIANDEAVALLKKTYTASTLEDNMTPPFHLVASFETFDYLGKPDGNGTIDEFWDGASRMRRSTTYRGATELTVLADRRYVSSEPFVSSLALGALLQGLLRPVSEIISRPNLVMERKPVKLGEVDLDCIAVASKPPSLTIAEAFPLPAKHDTYCLSNSHILRLANTSKGLTLIFNSLQTFGSKDVSHEITVKVGGMTRGKLHVNSLSVWTPDKATFGPPPNAVSFPLDNHDVVASGVPGRVIAGSKISGDIPQYPPSARLLRTAGMVVVSAVISRAGTVTGIEVMSAPSKDLAEAAVSAVKTWKYVPYLLNGQPTEVETTITVNFNP